MTLSRRQALGGIIAGTAAGTGGRPVAANPVPPAASSGPDGVCVLWPQLDQGPYYFDPKLVRADISDGRPGAPVRLILKIIEFGSCKPLAGARIDIWHCDAGGIYSGYSGQGDKRDTSTKDQTYLRGTQMTSADGTVIFNSIYPGWYPGRTPHIHIKGFLGGNTVVTGQAFFPDDVSARVYSGTSPYFARPVPDTTNTTDGIFNDGQMDGGGIVFALTSDGTTMAAALTIAIDRSGQSGGTQGWGEKLRDLFGGR